MASRDDLVQACRNGTGWVAAGGGPRTCRSTAVTEARDPVPVTAARRGDRLAARVRGANASCSARWPGGHGPSTNSAPQVSEATGGLVCRVLTPTGRAHRARARPPPRRRAGGPDRAHLPEPPNRLARPSCRPAGPYSVFPVGPALEQRPDPTGSPFVEGRLAGSGSRTVRRRGSRAPSPSPPLDRARRTEGWRVGPPTSPDDAGRADSQRGRGRPAGGPWHGCARPGPRPRSTGGPSRWPASWTAPTLTEVAPLRARRRRRATSAPPVVGHHPGPGSPVGAACRSPAGGAQAAPPAGGWAAGGGAARRRGGATRAAAHGAARGGWSRAWGPARLDGGP